MLKDLNEITIGPRLRNDLGDINGLAASIAKDGLLHPVVVTPDGRLIAGRRRIEALRSLGLTQIPVTTVDIDSVVSGEFAENVHRKDFLPSESVAISQAIEDEERRLAKERMANGGRGAKLAPLQKAKARDTIAARVGMKRSSLEKAKAIVAAAEAEPERFGKLVMEMDSTGKIDRAFTQLKIEQDRQAYEARKITGCAVDDLEALAASGFQASVLYPDCPWRYETYSEKGKQRSPDRYYDTMVVDQLLAMAPLIQKLAAKKSALPFWTVPWLMEEGFLVMRAWGFVPKTKLFCWVKLNQDGTPFLGKGLSGTRGNTEDCWLATRGEAMRWDDGVNQVILDRRADHSEKPDEARDRIMRLWGGPYLELFARKWTPGWYAWGNEISRDAFAAKQSEKTS